MHVHLLIPSADYRGIFEKFEHSTEIVQCSINYMKQVHIFQLDITEEDYFLLKIQYGNDVWKR